MHNLIHFGLIISCAANLFMLWSLHKCIKFRDQHIYALEKLVIEIAKKQIQGIYSNGVSIGKNHE